jgi:hypothetical protein
MGVIQAAILGYCRPSLSATPFLILEPRAALTALHLAGCEPRFGWVDLHDSRAGVWLGVPYPAQKRLHGAPILRLCAFYGPPGTRPAVGAAPRAPAGKFGAWIIFAAEAYGSPKAPLGSDNAGPI